MARKKKVSKKKTSKSKAVAKPSTGKEVVSWKDRLAQLAEKEADRQTVIGGGSQGIRLSKGSFKFQGEDLGDSIEIVVIASAKHKNYFDRPFDEDNPSPPACFAISSDGKGMAPHETSPVPQDDVCAECWANEFESDNRGKGKACRDSYLLACVAANELENLDEIDESSIAYLRVPPTSLAAWDGYMVKRNKVLHLPAAAFITQVTFDEEVDYQKILFDEVGRTPEEAFPVLLDQLAPLAEEILLTPPDVTNYEPPEAKGSKKKKKVKKKSKKKATKKSRF